MDLTYFQLYINNDNNNLGEPAMATVGLKPHRNHPEGLEAQGVTGTNQYGQMAALESSHNQTDPQREALPTLTNEHGRGRNSLAGTLFTRVTGCERLCL